MLHDRSPAASLDTPLPVLRMGACLFGLATSATAFAAEEVVLDPVVVTATRQAQRSFDLPVSIDTIDRRTI